MESADVSGLLCGFGALDESAIGVAAGGMLSLSCCVSPVFTSSIELRSHLLISLVVSVESAIMTSFLCSLGSLHKGAVGVASGLVVFLRRAVAAVRSLAAHGSDGLDFLGGTIGEVTGVGGSRHGVVDDRC
jgi:hypothetical protein